MKLALGILERKRRLRYTDLQMKKDDQTNFSDYYMILGVQPHVGADELKRAYVRLAREQHPDTGGDTEQMQLINQAYTTLKDDSKRRAYDLLHQFHTGTAELHYRVVGEDEGSEALDGMNDDEIDDFVNAVFREYSAPKPPEPLKKRLKQRLKSRKK